MKQLTLVWNDLIQGPFPETKFKDAGYVVTREAINKGMFISKWSISPELNDTLTLEECFYLGYLAATKF